MKIRDPQISFRFILVRYHVIRGLRDLEFLVGVRSRVTGQNVWSAMPRLTAHLFVKRLVGRLEETATIRTLVSTKDVWASFLIYYPSQGHKDQCHGSIRRPLQSGYAHVGDRQAYA